MCEKGRVNETSKRMAIEDETWIQEGMMQRQGRGDEANNE